MSEKEEYFTELKDGELAVRTVSQSGSIVPEEGKDPKRYVTALVQTDNGNQLCIKTVLVGGSEGSNVPVYDSKTLKFGEETASTIDWDNLTLGDRLGGIASYVGTFNSTNPDDGTTQRYAYFVLDAQYRTANGGSYGTDANLRAVLTQTSTPLTSDISSTYATDKVINSGITSDCAQAFITARQAAEVTVLSNIYRSQLPNTIELVQILSNAAALDAADETLSSHPELSLSTLSGFMNNRVYSCILSNYGNYSRLYQVFNQGNYDANTPGYVAGIIPVFEIPLPVSVSYPQITKIQVNNDIYSVGAKFEFDNTTKTLNIVTE